MKAETMTNEELADTVKAIMPSKASSILRVEDAYAALDEAARRLRATPDARQLNIAWDIAGKPDIGVVQLWRRELDGSCTLLRQESGNTGIMAIPTCAVATPASIGQGHNELPKEVMQSGQKNRRTLRSRSDMPGVEPIVPSPGSITIGQGAGTEWAVEAAKEIMAMNYPPGDAITNVAEIIAKHAPHPLAGGELSRLQEVVKAATIIAALIRPRVEDEVKDGRGHMTCFDRARMEALAVALSKFDAALTKGPVSP